MPDDTVEDALNRLVVHNVAALPVVNGGNCCVGVISASNLLELARKRGADREAMNATDGLTLDLLIEHLAQAGFSDVLVKEVMTPIPIVIDPDVPLQEAARIMVDHGIHHLAVTEHKHRFLGVLSSLDILRAWAEAPG